MFSYPMDASSLRIAHVKCCCKLQFRVYYMPDLLHCMIFNLLFVYLTVACCLYERKCKVQ